MTSAEVEISATTSPDPTNVDVAIGAGYVINPGDGTLQIANLYVTTAKTAANGGTDCCGASDVVVRNLAHTFKLKKIKFASTLTKTHTSCTAGTKVSAKTRHVQNWNSA